MAPSGCCAGAAVSDAWPGMTLPSIMALARDATISANSLLAPRLPIDWRIILSMSLSARFPRCGPMMSAILVAQASISPNWLCSSGVVVTLAGPCCVCGPLMPAAMPPIGPAITPSVSACTNTPAIGSRDSSAHSRIASLTAHCVAPACSASPPPSTSAPRAAAPTRVLPIFPATPPRPPTAPSSMPAPKSVAMAAGLFHASLATLSATWSMAARRICSGDAPCISPSARSQYACW